MSDDLYQAAILSHAKAAVGAGALAAPDVAVTVDNPLCGDRVSLELGLAEGRVVVAAQRVRGCLLCEAAASLLCALVPGASAEELAGVGEALAAFLRGEGPPPAGPWAELAVFAPVAAARSRHRCVLLPFEALRQALSPGG